MVTTSQIKKLFPRARADLVSVIVEHWNEAEAIGITKQRRIADFFAQIGTETGGLTSVSESLNYSADALIKKFGRHRISIEDARRLGRAAKDKKPLSIERQIAIANILYGGEWGRKNLGNVRPNDGWDMRGGGMMQTTGRAGYRKMGFENNPEALRTPLIAFRTALREWAARGCNERADRGDTKGNRKAINGGAMGLDDCLAYRAKAMTIFPPDPRSSRVSPLISMEVEDAEVVDPVGGASKPPAVVAFTDPARVRLAQQWLRNLNYMPIGEIDGDLGDQTRDAIRSYRAAKGLPAGDYIDFELMGTLASDTEPRQFAAKRANATPAEVREKAPEARESFRSRLWSGLGLIGSGAVAFANGVMEQFGTAKGYIEPVKEWLSDVPPWAWALAVFLVAAMIYRSSTKSEKAAVEAVQTGARR